MSDAKTLLAELDAKLAGQLESARAESSKTLEEWEELKTLRAAIQRKVEDLERAYYSVSSNVSRIAAEYERLATMSERPANAMALRPPESPVAPKRAVQAIKDVPRLVEELSAAAIPVKESQQICGVYFLLEGKDVVYVGQSVAVQYRVYQHVTEKQKKFDRWCFIAVKKAQLDQVEQFYITLLRPKLNKAGMPRLLADNDPALRTEAAC